MERMAQAIHACQCPGELGGGPRCRCLSLSVDTGPLLSPLPVLCPSYVPVSSSPSPLDLGLPLPQLSNLLLHSCSASGLRFTLFTLPSGSPLHLCPHPARWHLGGNHRAGVTVPVPIPIIFPFKSKGRGRMKVCVWAGHPAPQSALGQIPEIAERGILHISTDPRPAANKCPHVLAAGWRAKETQADCLQASQDNCTSSVSNFISNSSVFL